MSILVTHTLIRTEYGFNFAKQFINFKNFGVYNYKFYILLTKVSIKSFFVVVGMPYNWSF